MRRLLGALVALTLLFGSFAPVPAPAQGIDFTARGLAVQAQQRDAIPALANYADAYLIHYHAACGQVRTGDGRCKIAIVGDSTAAGWGAGVGGRDVNARARSFPAYLAKALIASGLPASVDNTFGNAAAASIAALTSYDPRVTFSGGTGAWAFGPSNVPGGNMLIAGSAVTQTYSFTPTGPVDRFQVWYPTNPVGLGSLVIKVDGGAATTVSENSAASLTSVTVSAASPGTHTLTITGNGAGNVYLAAVDAWNSTVPAATIANMGWPGSWVENWVTTGQPWENGFAVPAYGASLYIVDLGINSWTGASGTTLASFITAYQNLLTNIRNAGGDCLLLVPFPSATTGSPSASLATQQAYAQAIFALGKSNNCVMVDATKQLGSYAAQNNLGTYWDTVHPKAPIYANIAQLIATVLNR